MVQCAVILAGGEGKRMKSAKPKVLTEVLFEPMLQWVIDAVRAAGIREICVITGSRREQVDAYLAGLDFPVETAFQSQRLGTGHAVMMALPFLEKHPEGDVLILNGDAPFVDPQVITEALAAHLTAGDDRGSTVISAEVPQPKGYGRIVHEPDGKALKAIVEEKEATQEIREIKEVNSGAYWFHTPDLIRALQQLSPSELTGEYYLTDTIEIIKASGKTVIAHKAQNADSVLGANDCIQLSQLNEIARRRTLEEFMSQGVNIPCTDGVMIGRNVTIGKDTTILPASVLCGKAVIGSGCVIGPAAYINGGAVEDGACIPGKSV